jgi:hypothetical protein
LDRVSRAALRLLECSLRADFLRQLPHRFRLVSNDHQQLSRLQRLACAENIFEKRASPGLVQHLGQLGLHARPFSRG